MTVIINDFPVSDISAQPVTYVITQQSPVVSYLKKKLRARINTRDSTRSSQSEFTRGSRKQSWQGDILHQDKITK